jgi:Na+/melibiose symporter-like transporter
MATNESASESALRALAVKSLKKKRDAREFLIVTIVVNAILIGVWWLTTPGSYFWPMWVMFGMGIGVIFTYIDAYVRPFAQPMSEQDIENEIAKITRTQK